MFDLTLKNGEKNDNLLVALEKANYSAIKKLLYQCKKRDLMNIEIIWRKAKQFCCLSIL